MRFLVDECTGSGVAQWLREREHDVFSVYDDGGGMRDDAILRMANSERRIIVTNDRDFGEMIFREGRPHCGVIFLRVRDERTKSKIAVLEGLLQDYSIRLQGEFVVASENQIRWARR